VATDRGRAGGGACEMLKEKAQLGLGGGKDGKAANFSSPKYSIFRPKKQSIQDLSAMLDQALYLAEYHSDRADFHRCRADKHRRVLRSLQGLIPRSQINTEGDLVNG
jgi:hypothetical protein